MKPKSKKPESKIIRREYPRIRFDHRPKNGKWYPFFVVDCRGHGWKGQPLPEFPTKAEALAHAQDVAAKIDSFGVANVPHADFTLLERLKAKLLPIGVDLESAVDSFIESHTATNELKSSKVMMDVTSWYQQWKETKGLRGDSLRGIKMTCSKLNSTFGGNTPIGTITSKIVETALTEMDVKNATKNDYLKRFRTFFKWAKREGYIKENPCVEGLEFRADDKEETRILTNDEVLTVLGGCLEHPTLMANVATCLFAGMRPVECSRFKWEWAYMDERQSLYIPDAISKTGERHTPIHPTLLEWLKLSKGQPFKVKNRRRLLDEIKLDGSIDWQQDILRHTAISHYMGKPNDKENNIFQVAEWLGNKPETIKNYYQRAVLKYDNDLFWSLTPSKVKELIEEREKKKLATA